MRGLLETWQDFWGVCGGGAGVLSAGWTFSSFQKEEKQPLKIRSAKQLTLQVTHMKDALCCLSNHGISAMN